MANTLVVTAELRDKVSGPIKAVASAVNTSAADLSRSLGTAGKAATSGTGSFFGLEKAVKSYGREQREQGRNARLFASELSSILPVSNSLAGALGGVAASLVGGFGILAAFDLVKIAVGAVGQAFADAAAATKKANEELAKTAKSALEAKNRVAELTAELRFGPDVAADVTYQNAVTTELAAQREIEAEIARLRASLKDDTQNTVEGLAREVRIGKEIAALQNRIAESDAKIQAAALIRQKTMVGINEAKVRESQAAIRTAEAEERTTAAVLKRVEAAGLLPGGGLAPAGVPGATLAPRTFGPNSQAELDSAAGSLGGDLTGLPKGERFAELQAEAQKTGKLMGTALVDPMVEAWSTGIAAMITQQKTLREFFMESLAAMLKAVINTAIKAATAESVVGQVRAASANAWNPILALGAASVIGGIMTQLLGKMPSAAGGWQVPRDTVAMVHKDERILPARYSEGLDRLVEGAANGRMGGQIVINAVDPQSFGDFLRRGGADEVFKAWDRAARDGRR